MLLHKTTAGQITSQPARIGIAQALPTLRAMFCWPRDRGVRHPPGAAVPPRAEALARRVAGWGRLFVIVVDAVRIATLRYVFIIVMLCYAML